jgi:hypothetical protein
MLKLNLTLLMMLLLYANSNLISEFYKYSIVKKINNSSYNKLFLINSLTYNENLKKINDIILKIVKNFEYYELSDEERYYLLTVTNLLQ